MARCSETATDLQDLMLCCEARGWQYTIESSPVLEGDDGEELIPRGHRASVTTTRGYNALVLGTNAQDALRAALTAVEAMDERWVKQGPTPYRAEDAKVYPITGEPGGATETNGAGYARAQLSPDVPSVTWPASPEQVTMAEDPGPARQMAERLQDAYMSYRDQDRPMDARDFGEFRQAIEIHLGGTLIPTRRDGWLR